MLQSASLDQPEAGASPETTSSGSFPVMHHFLFLLEQAAFEEKKKSLHTNPSLRVCLWAQPKTKKKLRASV